MFRDLRGFLLPAVAALLVVGLLAVRFSATLRPAAADFFSPWIGAPDAVAERLDADSLFHYSKTELIRQIEEQRAQLADLERESLGAARLATENAELRGMLGLDVPVGYRGIPADVVSLDPANGMRVFRIDRGAADGVEAGQPVLANGRLVGRILETESAGLHSSLVVTVIDPNCRASVRVLGADQDGVLFGLAVSRWLASPRCLVKYLPRDLAYAEGAEIVTAAHDDQIPAGIPVGQIRSHEGQTIETIDNLYRQAYVFPTAFERPFFTVTVLRRITDPPPTTEASP